MFQKIKTKLKASALVVTMIILGIILVSTLSISLVAVQERKASMGENTSNQAYTNAENGVEIVMQAIKNGGYTDVKDLSNCNTTSGRIESDGYAIELKKSDDTKIACNDATAKISDIASVKSIGSAGQNQRAVQVAVAAGCINGQEIIYNSNNEDFTADNFNIISNYVKEGNHSVSGILCKGSSRNAFFYIANPTISGTIGDNSSYASMSAVGNGASNPIKFSCTKTHYEDSCTSYDAAPYGGWYGTCTGGWTVYGACTCPSNSC